jgi:hypothetical protein
LFVPCAAAAPAAAHAQSTAPRILMPGLFPVGAGFQF